MKKIFSTVIVSLWLLSGCSKKELLDGHLQQQVEKYNVGEEIAKRYGLYPENAELIQQFHLYTDRNNNRYLLGAKQNENGKLSFWFSKYGSDGQSILDIVHEDERWDSWALDANQLSDGSIVVENVVGHIPSTELLPEIKYCHPVIIDKNGKVTYVDVPNNYYYVDTYVFDGCFICDITQGEFEKLEIGYKKWAIQFDNSGNILNQGTELNIPKPDFPHVWGSYNYFVTVNGRNIEKIGVVQDADSTWTFVVKSEQPVSNPEIWIENDTVNVCYSLDSDERNVYRLSYKTGKQEPVRKIVLNEQNVELKVDEVFNFNNICSVEPANVQNVTLHCETTDENVVIVSGGKIKAVGAGECTVIITVEGSNAKAKCHVTVPELPIEEMIKVDVSGSYTSIDGLIIMGNLTATFYNRSNRKVKVTNFMVFDNMSMSIAYEKRDNVYVEKGDPLVYNFLSRNVYRPIFIWEYECEGETHEVKIQLE